MNTTERVTNILKHSVKSRNSDKELWLIFAQKFGVGLSPIQIEAIRDMPSFETLRRIRQKVQEQGMYEAAPGIKKERAHKAMVMQQTTPSFTSEQLEQTLHVKIMPWGQ